MSDMSRIPPETPGNPEHTADEAELVDRNARDVLGVEPASPNALASAEASGFLEPAECGSEPTDDELLDALWRHLLPQREDPQ